MASMRLYGLWGVSASCWILIAFGSASFVLGSCLASGFSIRISPRESSCNDDFDEKLFFLVFIFIYLITIPDFLQSLRLMMSGVDLAEIRLARFGMTELDGIEKRSGLIAILRSYIISSALIVLTASSINRFFISKGKIKFIIPVLGIIIMKSFINGGRFDFAYFFVQFMSCYYIYKLNDPFYKLTDVRKIIVLTIIPFALVLIISLLRQTTIGGETFLAKYYRYFCGCVVFLDQNLREKSSDFYSFSFASLYGIWQQVLPFFKNFMSFEYPETYLKTIEYVLDGQIYRQIGDHMYTNAFITAFYHLFMDLRYVGVFIGMSMFGFSSQLVYNEASRSKYLIVLYLMFMQFIFFSIFAYPFTSLGTINSFLILFFIKILKIRIV